MLSSVGQSFEQSLPQAKRSEPVVWTVNVRVQSRRLEPELTDDTCEVSPFYRHAFSCSR